jgi:hypothetical protein
MCGGDLPSNDEFTLKLITNDEVLAVNQQSTGGRELWNRDGLVAWVADVPNSRDKYLALPAGDYWAFLSRPAFPKIRKYSSRNLDFDACAISMVVLPSYLSVKSAPCDRSALRIFGSRPQSMTA